MMWGSNPTAPTHVESCCRLIEIVLVETLPGDPENAKDIAPLKIGLLTPKTEPPKLPYKDVFGRIDVHGCSGRVDRDATVELPANAFVVLGHEQIHLHCRFEVNHIERSFLAHGLEDCLALNVEIRMQPLYELGRRLFRQFDHYVEIDREPGLSVNRGSERSADHIPDPHLLEDRRDPDGDSKWIDRCHERSMSRPYTRRMVSTPRRRAASRSQRSSSTASG